MGKALYRKYRSRSLEELVGQEHVTDTLARAIKAGRINHAYLFTGPRGVGKTSVARILAHEINNIPYADTPNLDIIEIDAASNRRIDDIRDLREKVHIAPVKLPYKVYIIDEVHMLTGESFNALLKTLEEPPSHVVFILATTEFHKLPATIVSRTQRFSFRPGTEENMVPHLRMVADKEGIDIDDAALQLIAEYSDGGFRDSLSLLDQLSHVSTGRIAAEEVSTSLGLAPKEEIRALLDAWLAHDSTGVIKQVLGFQDKGASASSIVDQLAKEILSRPAHAESLQLLDALLDVPRAYSPMLKLISTLTAGHAAPTAKEQPRSAPTLATTPVTIAKVETKKRQVSKEPPKPPVMGSNPSSPATTPAEPTMPTDDLGSVSTEDWSRIMFMVKEKDPPVFAALKKGQPFVGDGKLIVKFNNSFMAKKLDGANQKAVVSECAQAVLGGSMAIEMIVDKSATPAVITENPQIASITNIMGGGELIDAPAL